MYISNETAEQTQARLLRVMAGVRLETFAEPYVFEEFPVSDLRENLNESALAYVRDEAVWSQLVPARNEHGELFRLISFHFQADLDNSGFVGWLASHLKQALGTGVFVVCGQNSGQGGIFDYWGCPWALGERFIAEVRALIAQGQQLTEPDANSR